LEVTQRQDLGVALAQSVLRLDGEAGRYREERLSDRNVIQCPPNDSRLNDFVLGAREYEQGVRLGGESEPLQTGVKRLWHDLLEFANGHVGPYVVVHAASLADHKWNCTTDHRLQALVRQRPSHDAQPSSVKR